MIKVTLKPHQQMMKDFLLTHKHGCLFCEAGTGKTFPTVEAIKEVATDNDNVLIISTKSVIEKMWMKDIKDYYVLPKNTLLVNFEKVIGSMQKELLSTKWKVIVIDEVHKCKSNNTKTSKMIHKLSANAQYVWGLTGTPRGNTDMDIFCIFRNLCIDGWGSMSYTSFIDNFCEVEKQYFGQRVFNVPVGIKAEYKNAWGNCVNSNAFKYTIEDLRKDDESIIKELKPANEIKIPYSKTTLYNDAINGIIKLQDDSETMSRLGAILKAHQACNGYVYLTGSKEREIFTTNESNLKIPYIKSQTDKHIIVVYRFDEDKRVLLENLDKVTDDYHKFKLGEHKYLLIQCGQCEGLNLQECTRVIFYTLDYSYIKYNQMYHRLYRIGQNKDINIDILMYKDTIEEKIWNAVKCKHKLSDLFFSIR